MRQIISTQFLKFLVVGGLNTVFGYLLFAGLIWAGLHYSVALFLATCIGVLFNFKTTGALVFKNSCHTLLVKYVALYIGIYFFNLGLMKILHLFLNNFYVVGLLTILPCALLSYFFSKKYIFVKKI
jgi:putative flippase GtrA